MLKDAFIKTSPVMAAYIFLGSAFGILAFSNGLSLWIPLFMSIFIYAGSMQFAAITLLVNPISLIQTFILTISINARHLFYGFSMLKPFNKAGFKKHYMTFALSDESFSLIINERNPDIMFRILLLNQSYWVFGTVLGYYFGQVIPFSTKGIEFSMTALFLVIFIDKLKEKEYFSSFSGLLISILCLLIFGSQHFIIPSMIGITIALLGRYK